MNILNLKVSGQTLINLTSQGYASDTVKYIGAVFELDDEWKAMDTVSAVWSGSGETISTVLDSNNYADIPPEVMTKVTTVKVNLVGSIVENNTLVERLTSFPCVALRITADVPINGSETAPVTPSQFEQFVANVKAEADRAEDARDDAESIKTEVEGLKADTEQIKTDTEAIKSQTAQIKTDTEAIVDGFDDKVDEAKADISNAKTDALNGIGSAKTDALTDINSAKTQAVTDVADEGTRQVDLVTEEGSTQVSAVRTEGQTQVEAVQTEGETQVNAVSTEGGTQITNIEQRGADVLSRIPYFAPIITDTAEGSIASFSDGADDYPMKSVVAEINPIQSGSGDPAPDNVRPISGWSGVNANSTGVNIWDEEWEVGNYNLETGEPNVYANAIRTKGYISVKPSTNYYSFVGNNSFLTRLFYDINKNYISYQSTRNGAFTTPANVHYMRFATQGGGAYGNVYLNDISINYPSTITTYSPYTGQSYSIPFKDSEGNPITVYGGNMNITDGEGEAFGEVDLGSLNWDYSNGMFVNYINPVNLDTKERGGYALCEQYKTVGVTSTSNMPDFSIQMAGGVSESNFWIKDSRFSNKEEFKQAVSGVKVVFEKKNPTPIYCEPTEIKSLKGNNNVWADTGDVSVEYCADTKLYIDKLKNAIISLGGNI